MLRLDYLFFIGVILFSPLGKAKNFQKVLENFQLLDLREEKSHKKIPKKLDQDIVLLSFSGPFLREIARSKKFRCFYKLDDLKTGLCLNLKVFSDVKRLKQLHSNLVLWPPIHTDGLRVLWNRDYDLKKVSRAKCIKRCRSVGKASSLFPYSCYTIYRESYDGHLPKAFLKEMYQKNSKGGFEFASLDHVEVVGMDLYDVGLPAAARKLYGKYNFRTLRPWADEILRARNLLQYDTSFFMEEISALFAKRPLSPDVRKLLVAHFIETNQTDFAKSHMHFFRLLNGSFADQLRFQKILYPSKGRRGSKR